MSGQVLAARRFYFKYILGRWWIYLIGIFSVLITNAMQVYSTRLVGWVIDFFNAVDLPAHLLGSDRRQTFINLFIFLLGSRLLLMISRWAWRASLGRQSHYAGGELKTKIWDHVRFFPRKDLDRKFTKGILMNANTSDVQSARMLFGFTIVMITDVIFLGLFTFLSMALIHLKMALLSLSVLILVPIFIRFLSEREIKSYEDSQNALGDLNDLSSQAVSTARLQRMTQTGDFWFKRLMTGAQFYRDTRLKAVNISLLFVPLMGSASILGLIAIFAYGLHLYFLNQLGLGDFLAMQGLAILLQDPLFELGFVISDWRKGRTSLQRLSEIFIHDRQKELYHQGAAIEQKETVLDVQNLSFKYAESERYLINDLNLTLKQGERLGITGPIGSGKSTLINLLAGLELDYTGKISLYGREFHEYQHNQLRRLVSVVHQKPFLFADTIRKNISVDRDMTEEQIWHVLKLASLDQDVKGFAQGIDTPLGEWGINLSGGQKQRMTLARALALRPIVLFLDDCLSAVDTVTEEKIMQNLHSELKGTTLVWVAHRKSTLKYCDRLLEMNHGIAKFLE